MSAASTGLVDFVMTVEEMPARLIAYHKHLKKIEPQVGPDGTRQDTSEHLAQVCTALRRAVGHDFSQYKEKTLARRIQRRMQMPHVDSTKAYVETLRRNPPRRNSCLAIC